MTPDEIIARNVHDLRIGDDPDNPKYSVTQLADKMGVSRSKVYHYEHRAGRPHAFKWSELIELCAALGCSIFELVLPDEGETIDVPKWVAQHIEPVDIPGTLGAIRVTAPGREELTRLIFHLPGKALDGLAKTRKAITEMARNFERDLQQRFFDQLRDLGAMTPDEYREHREETE